MIIINFPQSLYNIRSIMLSNITLDLPRIIHILHTHMHTHNYYIRTHYVNIITYYITHTTGA